MNKHTDKKEKLVFGYATTTKGLPVITLGISEACWEFMKGGSTHTLDLTKVGIPAQLVMFGGETYESVSKTLLNGLKAQGITIDDRRNDPGDCRNDPGDCRNDPGDFGIAK